MPAGSRRRGRHALAAGKKGRVEVKEMEENFSGEKRKKRRKKKEEEGSGSVGVLFVGGWELAVASLVRCDSKRWCWVLLPTVMCWYSRATSRGEGECQERRMVDC
jgi:hypothetical protein